MRLNLIPALEKELVTSSSVFQGCHLSMSQTFRCQMGKNMCEPCQNLDMQLTAATRKRSTTESQTWFASFIICSTGEDGTFCPRLSHMPPDSGGRVKEKNLGCHYGLRSKGCFGGQCFGSSTRDLTPDLFRLSKLTAETLKLLKQRVTGPFSSTVTARSSAAASRHQGAAG